MSIRRWFISGLIAATAGLFGCTREQRVEPRPGGIEVLVRGDANARTSGALTLSRDDGAERWRLPLRASPLQSRRVTLSPGLYTLDYEPDFQRSGENDVLPVAYAVAGALPRWVVVAPARLTSIVVQLEAEPRTTHMASAPWVNPALN